MLLNNSRACASVEHKMGAVTLSTSWVWVLWGLLKLMVLFLTAIQRSRGQLYTFFKANERPGVPGKFTLKVSQVTTTATG